MSYEIRVEGATENHSFRHEETNPIYGTGQGSGNSPIIWLFISNALLKKFARETQGATYRDHHSQEYTKIQVSAYVDDVNTHHNVVYNNNELETSMQQDFQSWKEILEMSGGKLAPEKCNYYTVKWKFAPTGRPEIEDTNDDQLKILHTGVTIEKNQQPTQISRISNFSQDSSDYSDSTMERNRKQIQFNSNVLHTHNYGNRYTIQANICPNNQISASHDKSLQERHKFNDTKHTISFSAKERLFELHF